MKANSINRRDFMKVIISCAVIPPIYLIAENENSNLSKFSVDDDYVEINGWILLKADVDLD